MFKIPQAFVHNYFKIVETLFVFLPDFIDVFGELRLGLLSKFVLDDISFLFCVFSGSCYCFLVK